MNFRYSLLLPALLFILFIASSGCKKPIEVPDPQTVITFTPGSLNIEKNEALGYPLTVKINDATVDPTTIKWQSADTTIASVDNKGFVRGKFAGETEITATLSDGKGSAKCKVTVFDNHAYKFRLVLKDKGTSTFSIAKPEAFLSTKAIERRKKHNIAIDDTDLPISPDYIKQIKQIGGVVVAQSKWLNTVSVYCDNSLLMLKYKQLPFVKDVAIVWQGAKTSGQSFTNNTAQAGVKPTGESSVKDEAYYGSAWLNISTDNGQFLHNKGLEGKGIDIAVIDEGFNDINTNALFSTVNIIGAKSFIYEDSNPYNTDDHGVWVTSCMAVNKPGYYVGTAPKANYLLLRSEDSKSEFAIEEDYWVAAIEYADSAGVSIVNTSLTYTYHDGGTDNHKYEDMDGKTALATRGANMAIQKGIFIACCAGNNQSWVGAPADAADVLTVGSINRSGNADEFTAFGITVDGRVKPDVMALGGQASVINVSGTAERRNGTSYASPITCGLVACLWQAYPGLSNKQLLDIIRKSANRYNNPVMPYGYGIPDMGKAFKLAQAVVGSN